MTRSAADIFEAIVAGREHPPMVRRTSDVTLLPANTDVLLASPLSDELVVSVLQLRALRVLLHGGSCTITDTGLALLSKHLMLEHLDLEWCATLSAQGLEALAAFPALTSVDLSFVSACDAPLLDRLRVSRPDLQIAIASDALP